MSLYIDFLQYGMMECKMQHFDKSIASTFASFRLESSEHISTKKKSLGLEAILDKLQNKLRRKEIGVFERKSPQTFLNKNPASV